MASAGADKVTFETRRKSDLQRITRARLRVILWNRLRSVAVVEQQPFLLTLDRTRSETQRDIASFFSHATACDSLAPGARRKIR